MLQHYRISVESCPVTDDVEFLSKNLSADAELQGGCSKNQYKLAVFIRDGDSTVAGGLIAEIAWGWLYILKIWVQDDLRGKGFGTKLIEAAETEAKQQGCRNAHLETFSFQARPLYEKLGYEVIGTLDNYPPGHKKYFMKKCLLPEQ